MGVSVHLFDEAQDYLIDKGRDLDSAHRLALKDLFGRIEVDPYCGKRCPEVEDLPIRSQFYVSDHIGGAIHATLYYDIETRHGNIDVLVRSIWIGFMF